MFSGTTTFPHQRRIAKKFVVMTQLEIYKNRYDKTMRNKDLQELLSKFPDDAIVAVEYCDVKKLQYFPDRNLIAID